MLGPLPDLSWPIHSAGPIPSLPPRPDLVLADIGVQLVERGVQHELLGVFLGLLCQQHVHVRLADRLHGGDAGVESVRIRCFVRFRVRFVRIPIRCFVRLGLFCPDPGSLPPPCPYSPVHPLTVLVHLVGEQQLAAGRVLGQVLFLGGAGIHQCLGHHIQRSFNFRGLLDVENEFRVLDQVDPEAQRQRVALPCMNNLKKVK